MVVVKAESITEQEWQLACKVQNVHDLFNLYSRKYVTKQALPAQKVHMVEFFAKP